MGDDARRARSVDFAASQRPSGRPPLQVPPKPPGRSQAAKHAPPPAWSRWCLQL